MAAIDKVTATGEVNKWLDFKKINDRKRESFKENIETLVDAVMDGSLVIDDKCNLVQTLKFPTEGEAPVTKLEFKPRLKVETVQLHLQGVKASDGDARITAYIAALTSKPKKIIQALDTEDYSIGQAIAVFFL